MFDSLKLFGHQLATQKPRIGAVGGDQIVVHAPLDKTSVVKDQNHVGGPDGRDPMGDDDRRALGHVLA